MRIKIFVSVLLIGCCVFGFSQMKIDRSYYKGGTQEYMFAGLPPFDWPISNLEEQGFDPYILSHAYEKAEELGFMYSLLVIRNGYLVAEQYFNGKTKYDSFNIASASKSFIGALIGIALKENYLISLDQKMMDFFPEYATSELDPRKYDITIRQLLQMRAGYPFDESQYPGTDEYVLDMMILSSNWMKFAIETPLANDPGDAYLYSTLSTHILSGIITKATGMSTREFADIYLFDPLDINVSHWAMDPQYYFIGGFRMYFKSRNMARLGYLYLNNGYMDGKQILPEDWVEKSTKTYSTGVAWYQEFFEELGYGYLWWTAKAGGYDIYCASGYGGQNIVNIPVLNMIVVTTTNSSVTRQVGGSQANSVRNLIANYVLPAAGWNYETPPYPPSGTDGSRVENRSLLLREYIDVLKWKPNPLNNGENVSAYRIYYYTDESGTMTKVLIDKVNASKTEYWFRNVPEDNLRAYGIASVTNDDRESIPAIITVR